MPPERGWGGGGGAADSSPPGMHCRSSMVRRRAGAPLPKARPRPGGSDDPLVLVQKGVITFVAPAAA